MAMPVKSGYSDFPENWKVPKTCFFFFKVIVFMKEQNLECFWKIGKVYSTFQKILKINLKMATPVWSGYSDFAKNWNVPKHAFFSSKRLFSWKNKILNVSEEFKGYFQYFKKYSKSTKKWHAGKVRIQRFCRKLRSPQKMLFFFKVIIFMKEWNFECFRRIGRVFSTFQKIFKINQKMARR